MFQCSFLILRTHFEFKMQEMQFENHPQKVVYKLFECW